MNRVTVNVVLGLMVLLFLFVGTIQSQGIDWVIGGKEDESANAVVQAWYPDGGFVLAGRTRSFSPAGFDPTNIPLIVLTDGRGNLVRYLSTTDLRNGTKVQIIEGEATSMIATSDKNYVVTGWVRLYREPNVTHLFVLKLNPMLDEIWEYVFHTEKDLNHKGLSVVEYFGKGSDSELGEGYAVTGWCSRDGKSNDVLVLRLSTRGGLQWANTYNFEPRHFRSEGYSICQVNDPNFPEAKLAVVGMTVLNPDMDDSKEDAFLMILREDGAWIQTKAISDSNDRQARSVVWDENKENPGIVVAGWENNAEAGAPRYSNIWVSKFVTRELESIWSNNYFWRDHFPTNDKVWGDKSLIVTRGLEGEGYALTGFTTTFSPDSDTPGYNLMLMRLLSDGSLGWGEQASVYPLNTAGNDVSNGGHAVIQIPANDYLGLNSDGFAVVGWSNLSCEVTKKTDFLLTFFNAQEGNGLVPCHQMFSMNRREFKWNCELATRVQPIFFNTGGLSLFECEPEIHPACQSHN